MTNTPPPPPPPPRDITPVTGEEWRRLGFYHELDQDQRVWRLCGSRSGLGGLAKLIARHAHAVTRDARPLQLGPYGDLQVKFWDRPGIDDDSIHGPPEDLRRLVELIESRLKDTAPGGDFEIGAEYAHDVEYSLVFEVMDDDFDPADAIVLVVDDIGGEAAFGSQLGFKFHDTESEGVIRLEGDDIVMQYERKDFAAIVTKITDAFVGSVHSNIVDLVIPLSEVTMTRFKRGMFWADLALHVRDMKLIEGVPAVKAGALRLRFRRADRDPAAQLAAAIDELIG